jgi:hypothetical protein
VEAGKKYLTWEKPLCYADYNSIAEDVDVHTHDCKKRILALVVANRGRQVRLDGLSRQLD